MHISVVLQAPSYHLLFEAILIVAIIRLFFVKSYKPERTVLTEKVRFYLRCFFAINRFIAVLQFYFVNFCGLHFETCYFCN